jgi:hypothetical protein
MWKWMFRFSDEPKRLFFQPHALGDGLLFGERQFVVVPPEIGELQNDSQVRRFETEAMLSAKEQGRQDAKTDRHHVNAPFFLRAKLGLASRLNHRRRGN